MASYSVPDCRDYFYFPNKGVVVQGTIQYTGQTSCDELMPRVDSRKAGAPVDSRLAANIPINSRTPGINGPGN